MDWLLSNASAGTARDHDYWSECLRAAGMPQAPRPVTDIDELRGLDPGDRVLAAGGDGTLNRVAPLCAARDVTLGVLPAGTGNDFARGLGVPLDPEQACATIVAGHTRTLDLASLGEVRFLNVAHIGLGTEVTREAAAQKRRGWGRLSYLRALFDRLQRRRGFKATIVCGGETRRARWLEIAVANGVSFGGGHRVFEASPDDGLLDVVAIRPRPLWYLLWIGLRARLFDATPRDPAVVRLRGASCEVARCRPLEVRADGEPVGRIPGRFGINPSALRVLVPAESTSNGDTDVEMRRGEAR